jgi:hypothetical protein
VPQTMVRVVGSGFSTFRWRGKPLAFLEQVRDSGQEPIVGLQPIHPMDSQYPVEFASPRAMDAGTLSFTVTELWNAPVWQTLGGLENANNIVDIWTVLAQDPSVITCQTIIKPPQGNFWRVKTYHNVMIASVDDSETISIGALSVARTVNCMYTNATRETIVANT